jgi:hypothetical protein
VIKLWAVRAPAHPSAGGIAIRLWVGSAGCVFRRDGDAAVPFGG